MVAAPVSKCTSTHGQHHHSLRGTVSARRFVKTAWRGSDTNRFVSGRVFFLLPTACCLPFAALAARRSGQRRHGRTLLLASKKTWLSPFFSGEGEVLQSGGSETRPLGKAEAKFCASRGFDPEEWQKHASPTRYIRELSGLFSGTTTTRVIAVVGAFTLWAFLTELYFLLQDNFQMLPDVAIPLTPFELTAPLIGLLLVFRTDKSYDRHKEGNEALWVLSAKLTDLLRGILSNTDDEDARSLEDVKDLCSLIADYHTWLLTSHLLQDAVESNRQKYGGPAKSVGHRKAAALNRRLCRADSAFLVPSHVQLAISQEINKIPRLNEQQRQGLDAILWEVTELVTKCERLLRSPIPLGYTRSTIRFLWLWLALLPFALIPTFQEFRSTNLVIIEVPIVIFFVSLVFLSLEDVAVQIEEPFAVKRVQLSRLARWFEQETKELMEISEARYGKLKHETETKTQKEGFSVFG
eukprot:TRINITY_DN20629_c0_g1_i1.p1 TRINITY_DN20629_c0_g1~~TRINITY_DN20629_c0_g1_i1.p1  ORF type:complete len:466 (-),score=35.17 TRINITY_DN20629_c0_g1_i1:33-1430(-)